ncbi:unnamed protein product [Musa acuminata subsp. malaccensis]|uniref:Uncharacterized protein n=1 Tax=Musa acuminata subsp. malaccensis TaxID=214687 RepID=A0A804KZS5_MUSAM|nr:unnamed protein product [Musa acuminata subsp. malaccensis]
MNCGTDRTNKCIKNIGRSRRTDRTCKFINNIGKILFFLDD